MLDAEVRERLERAVDFRGDTPRVTVRRDDLRDLLAHEPEPETILLAPTDDQRRAWLERYHDGEAASPAPAPPEKPWPVLLAELVAAGLALTAAVGGGWAWGHGLL